MKTRIVVTGLLMSMVAGGAFADNLHFATASTKKDAKRIATASARAEAQRDALCYRPARQVGECQAVEGGFRCRADTSANPRQCWRAGWVNEYTPSSASRDATRRYRSQWSSFTFAPYVFDVGRSPTYYDPGNGPPAPTPFPPN